MNQQEQKCGCVTAQTLTGTTYFVKKCKIGLADPGHLTWVGVRVATETGGVPAA